MATETPLPAPTRKQLTAEITDLAQALLDMDVPASAIRRYARQAKRGTKPPDEVLNASDRTGLRVADEWDYIADMQDCIRDWTARGFKTNTVTAALNRVLPKSTRSFAQQEATKRAAAASGMTSYMGNEARNAG